MIYLHELGCLLCLDWIRVKSKRTLLPKLSDTKLRLLFHVQFSINVSTTFYAYVRFLYSISRSNPDSSPISFFRIVKLHFINQWSSKKLIPKCLQYFSVVSAYRNGSTVADNCHCSRDESIKKALLKPLIPTAKSLSSAHNRIAVLILKFLGVDRKNITHEEPLLSPKRRSFNSTFIN